MRKLLQFILLKPILWASKKFASRPQRERIFSALSALLKYITDSPGKKGITIHAAPGERFIVFSDQHRGAKNGADDFMKAEPNYLAALDYYFKNEYGFISLGDSEELWENTLYSVKKHNTLSFEAEKKFINENRFYKIFGNHDLFWANDPLAWWHLKRIYGQEIKVYEGLVLKPAAKDYSLTIFLTHGHQGDASSDGNWFSKFFVARIWAPLQAYLKINPNTPAYDEEKKTDHNHIMYEWSAGQENLILVTGHTHQPVFESLTHPERLMRKLTKAIKENNRSEIIRLEEEIRKRKKDFKSDQEDVPSLKPSYFNSGCCCFRDGDITGIEITPGKILLVKWSVAGGREILEEAMLKELMQSAH